MKKYNIRIYKEKFNKRKIKAFESTSNTKSNRPPRIVKPIPPS